MPDPVVDVVLTAVAVLLLANFSLALVLFSRRRAPGSWLLIILLGSTTGAALAAMIALLAPDGGRFADVAVVLTGTAVVAAAVRAGAQRPRTWSSTEAEEPG